MKQILKGLLAVTIPTIALAERTRLTEPLISDRPDFTESAETIPAEHLQLEAGYTFTQDSADGETSREHALPEMLLRIGLSENIEARLAWEGALIEDPAQGGSSHGVSDMSVGTKIAFGEFSGVKLSTIIDMEIPTGSDNRTADRVQPGAKLLWSTSLTDDVAVAGNINYASRVTENDRFNEWGASLTFGTEIAEKTAGYIEFFGIYPDSTPVADAESYLNGGVTYLVHNDLQLDARIGTGLNENAADLFSGVGFVWRY